MEHKKTAPLGTLIIAAVGVGAIVPWLLLRPLTERFSDSFAALTSVGQVSALLGTALFAVFVILYTQEKRLTAFFRTDAQQSRVKRVTQTAAFLLLVTHPVLLAVKLVPESWYSAAQFLLPGGDWAINFGVYALLLYVLYLLISYLAKRQRASLRVVPHVLSAILFLGTLHAFMVPSSLTESLFLRVYILTLVGVSLLSYGEYVIARYFRGKSADSNTLSESDATAGID